jgi:hypothetical protein
MVKAMSDDFWQPIIETDLTDEEQEIIDASRDEYKNHPENFCSLDEYMSSRNISTAE